MMWQAASLVDLCAHAATIERAGVPVCMRQDMKWRAPGASWRNG
jgi:hypothetical protein